MATVRVADRGETILANVLIAFYSRDGSTEQLATAVAAGVQGVGGATRLRRARETVVADTMALVPGWADAAARMNEAYAAPSVEDARWADAIVFGSPTRFGMIAAELKAYIDSLGALWARGELSLVVGSAFTSTSTRHGGNEMTIVSLMAPMAHFGMVIVPPGYADPVMLRAGTPYGATSVSYGQQKLLPTDDDKAVARFQGARVAQVADALRTLRTATVDPAT